LTFGQNIVSGSAIELNPLSIIASVLGSLVLLGSLAISSDAVSQWYGNGRFKSYSAVTLALVLSMIVAIFAQPIELLMIYVFVKPD
jgi:hypothetical protein